MHILLRHLHRVTIPKSIYFNELNFVAKIISRAIFLALITNERYDGISNESILPSIFKFYQLFKNFS